MVFNFKSREAVSSDPVPFPNCVQFVTRRPFPAVETTTIRTVDVKHDSPGPTLDGRIERIL